MPPITRLTGRPARCSTDAAQALRVAFDSGRPVAVRADTAEGVRAALARPEVSCALVRAEDRELTGLDLRALTYG